MDYITLQINYQKRFYVFDDIKEQPRELNRIGVGGEGNRAEYIPYNRLDDIHDVIIAYDDAIPVGSASFKKYDDECAEVKRVFVKQEYRGEPLVAAMALYKKIGYEIIPNYGQYKDMPNSICMKKKL